MKRKDLYEISQAYFFVYLNPKIHARIDIHLVLKASLDGKRGRARGGGQFFLPVLENVTPLSWKREIRSYNQTLIIANEKNILARIIPCIFLGAQGGPQRPHCCTRLWVCGYNINYMYILFFTCRFARSIWV